MSRTGKMRYPSFGWQGFFIFLLLAVLVFGVGGDFFFALASNPDKAKWTKAQTEMGEITRALSDYKKSHGGTYPQRLDSLEQTYFPSGVPKNPFSKDVYIYERTASGFRLTCLGKDRERGGDQVPDLDIVYDETGLR